MAFRGVQGTITLLLFLLCLNLLIGTDKKTAAVNIREKCMCLRETDGVPMRRVSNFNVINSGPHCYKVQIIVFIGSKAVCLAPNSKQGEKLHNCWKRINFNERKKKKVCLASGKVKRKQKKPKTA
ncbi:chemokine (C-X-C motif) ligand 18a, duplicate 1 [Silurus meridionalis]|uniref:chemokine (C-X-C motif) ligand 18a, duplicate 1 n=1 Tax=Silurus meridionalis TaxID=175797 RepID=UPI001EEAF139|nr:chemokine (C-X-C motif) ligand 18a, duplicate 1 [Silurus meridionalis]